MKKQETKKVLYLFGNEQEFGQALGNIVGLNPDLIIHKTFTTSKIRLKEENPLTLPKAPSVYETVIMAYIVYTNPGDIKLVSDTAPGEAGADKIRATFKPLIN